MGDFVAVGSALYTACDNASTVPVYYAQVPQGSAFPAIVINRQAAVDVRTFTSEELSADYQVKVISNRNWPQEAAAAYDALHATLDGTALTVTGYTALRCERTSTIEYRDADGYWHIGGLYRVDVHKT
jgi:hypothetical protein